MSGFRPCAIIPTYDNPRTIAAVVESVREHLRDIIVVDDGSTQPVHGVGDVELIRREHNGGKGAAVKMAFEIAVARGFTHALQIDADGQHCSADIPRFVEAGRARPEALILGAPVFGSDAPKARLWGRLVSVGFVHLETGGRIIRDPLCGYRLYPLHAAVACAPRADHMEFDPEIAVRMVWRGVPVINVETAVTYVSRAQGGVSHFKLFRDNFRISLMHSRLMTQMIMGRLFSWLIPALGRHSAALAEDHNRAGRPAA
ncbi:MAG TPA: glycosyltransferase family 2 protein [Polyangiales bacterium]|nr:glycosyltransferase family 2 protein [Polyangiales bacterium]